MAVKQLELPIFHYDNPVTGLPLSGGKVYIYAAGTSNSINTWQDSGQSTLNSNPVVLDSYGNAKIWFAQSAKIIVKNSDDTVTYFTFDNISPTGGTTTVTGDYNLVLNGSFEAAEADSTPTNWTITPYDATVPIEVDTTNVRHGKQSLKFDGQTGFGGGTATSAKFDVTSHTLLHVSLDTYASNATTTNDIQVFWYQKDDTASATTSNTLSLPAEGSYPTSWTHYNFMIAVPSDATRAEIKITGIDSGGSNLDADAYFDNVLVLDNQAINIDPVDSAVNWIKATPAATTVNPKIGSEGEANTGIIIEDSNGNEIIVGESTASATTHVVVTNNSTGQKPSINAGGEDVGIDVEGVELHNGTITKGGVEVLTYVPLSTPYVTGLPTNMGASIGNNDGSISDSTLSSAGAKAVRIHLRLATASATTGARYVYLSDTAPGSSTEHEKAYVDPNLNHYVDSIEVDVPLDGSQDYYYRLVKVTTADDLTSYVVGYYV